MKRRELVICGKLLVWLALLTMHSVLARSATLRRQVPGSQPNILSSSSNQIATRVYFPRHQRCRYVPFPDQADVYTLWKHGVKFTNHFTAALRAGPSRGLLTGLYSHQTWLLETILDRPYTASSSCHGFILLCRPTAISAESGYQTP